MNIKIYYCGEWNYLPEASRLEEELNGNFNDLHIELIEGKGGTFLVIVEDVVIFDKLALYKTEAAFPKNEEISNKIYELNKSNKS